MHKQIAVLQESQCCLGHNVLPTETSHQGENYHSFIPFPGIIIIVYSYTCIISILHNEVYGHMSYVIIHTVYEKPSHLILQLRNSTYTTLINRDSEDGYLHSL